MKKERNVRCEFMSVFYYIFLYLYGQYEKMHLIEDAEFLSGLRDGLLSPRLNTSSSSCTAAVHRVFHY